MIEETVIVIPANVEEKCYAIYNGTTTETLKNELEILRVMRSARKTRLDNQQKKIPKFNKDKI